MDTKNYKYLVAVKTPYNPKIYDFDTEESRQNFIDYLVRIAPDVEYATSEIEIKVCA